LEKSERPFFMCARHGAQRRGWRCQPIAKANREVTWRCKSSGDLDDRNPEPNSNCNAATRGGKEAAGTARAPLCPVRGRLQCVCAVESSGRAGADLVGGLPHEAPPAASESREKLRGTAVESQIPRLQCDAGPCSAPPSIAGSCETAEDETAKRARAWARPASRRRGGGAQSRNARLGRVLSVSRRHSKLRRFGQVASPQTPLHSVATVEAATHPNP
jgi:hypothetical protein